MLCDPAAMKPPPETIRSTHHPLLARVRAALAGRGEGELVLEGDRLVDDARAAGFALEVVLVDEQRAERRAELERAGCAVRAVQGSVLASVSALERSPGCLALLPEPRRRPLAELPATQDLLIVVAAGIQDPGNLGALARTAEAAGAGALVVTSGGCRPWNAKVLRGSMGSVLRLPVFEVEPTDALVRELDALGFRHVCARTREGRDHRRFDWSARVCLWLTAETGEFPGELARASAGFEGVTIATAGAAEALDEAAAAAVLLFSAGRTGGAP
jgi:TrmH family RNA methyltransferase